MANMFEELLKLEKNTYTNGLEGKKICIYGDNGTGKTYQATRLPKTLLIEAEAGGSAVNCHKMPCQSWAIATNIIKALTDTKTYDQMKEKFQTIVIDTAEQLVNLSELAVAKQYGVTGVGEVAQATQNKVNGYALARANFAMEINKLTTLGYTVVFIMHEEKITKVDEVTGEEYVYVQPKGSSKEKGSLRFIKDLCDFTIYLKSNGMNAQGEYEKSTAICKNTKYVFARSRFDIQPFITPFTAKGLEQAVQDAVTRTAEEEEVEIKTFEVTENLLTLDNLKDMIEPYVKKLYPMFPNEINGFITTFLGEGVKISQVTDEQKVGLENLYNNLVTFATVQGINI